MKHVITVSDARSYRPGNVVSFYGANGKLRGDFYVSKRLSDAEIRVRPITWFWRNYFKARYYIRGLWFEMRDLVAGALND